MKHKTKIAIYSGTIPSSTFIERLVEGIAENGNHVLLFGLKIKNKKYKKNISVFSYSNKFQKAILLIKYSIVLFFFKNSEKKKLDSIIDKIPSNKYLLKIKYYPVLFHKPDIFHLQWAKSCTEWMWVQEFGIKLILSLRGTHITISPKANLDLEAQYQLCFPKIDGFHAVSNSIKNEMKQYDINPDKIKVIYSGLDINNLEFKPLISSNTTLNIVSIGRSHWVKGYDYALDACAILKNQNFDFHYTIIGIDENEELIFQRNQLKLEQNVTFINHRTFNQVVTIINQADVVLLSSVEEGIANVVLEAMALGTIVVATNCGGLNEIITDNKNGFLVATRNANEIAEKIKYVSSLSIESKQNILKSARKTIEQLNSKEKMIAEMQDLYFSVLNQ